MSFDRHPQNAQVAGKPYFDYPGAPLATRSKVYIARPPVEQQVLAELEQPGSLIRIRAPRKMGKTSLLFRMIEQAHQLGYGVTVIDFHQAETSILSDLERLLIWLCHNISLQLGLATSPDEVWDFHTGHKLNCTLYLQDQVLRIFDNPVVLFLRHIDALLPYPWVTQELFPLLRGWFEDARWLEQWQKLRLVMTHDTEIYVPLKLYQSPFNVGLSVRLPEFTQEQVQALAHAYDLSWFQQHHASALTELVGGHPYLVAIACHHLATQAPAFATFLAQASFPAGIYGDHLRGYWSMVMANPPLLSALQQLIQSPQASLSLDAILAYQLESTGLVILTGDQVSIRCPLYHQYLAHQFQVMPSPDTPDPERALSSLHQRLRTIEQETQDLQQLVNIDSVTQFLKRQTFRSYLTQFWSTAIETHTAVALMVCSIDYLSVYIEAYGHDQGDICIHQIALLMRSCTQQPDEHFARFGLDEVVILIQDTTLENATTIAENIRTQVEALQIHHAPQYLGLPLPVITVSIGGVYGIPQPDSQPNDFLAIADQALVEAIRQGRNRVNLLEEPHR
jgi:diguanylate cyclase (GGDEF)-like protein